MDSAATYILKVQRAIETNRALRPPTKVQPFSPLIGPGTTGPLTNEQAMDAFSTLQELGVIRPVRYQPDGNTLEYEWSALGEEVMRLIEKRDN